jgi:hypothetical protein
VQHGHKLLFKVAFLMMPLLLGNVIHHGALVGCAHAKGGVSPLAEITTNGMIDDMKLRMDKSGRVVSSKIHPKTAKTKQPSMIQVDGLWIHQGAAEPGANWERVLNDVREERIQTVLKR